MANFSSRKKASSPPSKVANNACASAFDSNASGNACNSDVDNRMPTDRLTIRSTTFDSSENENTAAAEMLRMPAMVVASRMESSVESIFSLGSYATKLQIKTQTASFGKWMRMNAHENQSNTAATANRPIRHCRRYPSDFLRAALRYAMGFEPCQATIPSILCIGLGIAGPVIGMERMA